MHVASQCFPVTIIHNTPQAKAKKQLLRYMNLQPSAAAANLQTTQPSSTVINRLNPWHPWNSAALLRDSEAPWTHRCRHSTPGQACLREEHRSQIGTKQKRGEGKDEESMGRETVRENKQKNRLWDRHTNNDRQDVHENPMQKPMFHR